jgi:hypothetical protein
MMVGYKCTYVEVNNDRGSKNFGFLIERTKRFAMFNEAVDFARKISNTSINMVGRPVIEEDSETRG